MKILLETLGAIWSLCSLWFLWAGWKWRADRGAMLGSAAAALMIGALGFASFWIAELLP